MWGPNFIRSLGGLCLTTFDHFMESPPQAGQASFLSGRRLSEVNSIRLGNLKAPGLGVLCIAKVYLTVGTIFSLPPMYICSGAGILTDPSSWSRFSRKAISILGGATTVLFRVWAK